MDVAARPDLAVAPVQRAGEGTVADGPLPADGGGQPMDAAVQSRMEDAFDADFSAVRIHQGERASALGARAYTQGTDIHFAPGRYQPDSPAGQALLGHELTHVVQQSQGRVNATVQMKGVGVNDDRGLEREADEMGARVARGERVRGSRVSAVAAPMRRANVAQRASAVVQRDAEEVDNQLYGHGAFMGSAIDLLEDRKWRDILAVLMPDVMAVVIKDYEIFRGSARQHSRAAKAAAMERIIKAMENNPVCAAYGTDTLEQLDQQAGPGEKDDRVAHVQGMEWDVFLPKDQLDAFNQLVRRNPENTTQLSQHAHLMVEDMLIAHGNRNQTIAQGGAGLDQYHNVENTAKTAQGGVRPAAWMDLFGRAILLARGSLPRALSRRLGDDGNDIWSRMESEPREPAGASGSKAFTFQDKMPFSSVIALYKHYYSSGQEFKVILDIKSLGVTPTLLNYLVRELNTRGVLVQAIGSFNRAVNEQSELVDQQNIGGTVHQGPTQVIFLHGAGDLDKSDTTIRDSDHYLFNGASLIEASGDGYVVKDRYIRLLENKNEEHGGTLQFGIYAQEPDISPSAFRALTEYVNSRPDLFQLGFAWGGPPDYGDREEMLSGKGWGGQDWLRHKIADGGEETDERTAGDLATSRSGFQQL